MPWISLIIASFLLGFASDVIAAEPPLVEKYLHSGQLAKGEQVLAQALEVSPKNDQIRFGLGVLQVVRGVERLGQSLHEYGCRSEHTNMSFVRLPVPENPDPSPVTYLAFRRVLSAFHADLATAEATLSGVTDPNVILPLRLADICLDVDGDGQATDKLIDILKKLMGRVPEFADNPEFLVHFDRGDVAWLRAYCHLLMGMLDFQLAFDLESTFNLTADTLFAHPKHQFKGEESIRNQRLNEKWKTIAVKEPARLNHCRKHLLAVCELNHETWKFIRKETDDDHEWLPNAKQKGVIGLPVTDAMVDAWLGMIDEFHGLLDGTKVIPAVILSAVGPQVDNGLSIKLLLEDPPENFEWERIAEEGPAAKYLVKNAKDVDILKILRVGQVFQNSLSVGYAMYFN